MADLPKFVVPRSKWFRGRAGRASTMTATQLAAHYASEGVPIVLWPRDILPTCPPPPPSKPQWATVEAWLAELPRLRGCFCEAEILEIAGDCS